MHKLGCLMAALAVAASAHAGVKPYAFGRFGFSNDDGLLTMNVSPGGIEVEGGPHITWQQHGTPKVASITATEKTLALPPTKTGPANLRYTLLYPGMEAGFGPLAKVSFSDNRAFGVSLNGGPIAAPGSGWITAKSPDVVVMSDEVCVPIIVTMNPTPRRVRFLRDTAVERTIEIEGDRPTTIRFTVPSLERRSLPDAAAVRRFLRLVDTHAPIARLLKETYTLDRNAGAVAITDVYTPANAHIVLPPMLAFAASHEYPVKPIATGALFCKYGPLVFGGAKGTASYRLPVPPTSERGYLAPAKTDALQPLLNDLCGHWPAAWCRNGVDLSYAGVTNAAMAWNLLTHESKAKARSAWKTYLDAGFRLPPYSAKSAATPWKTMRDPFSGKSFLWGYSIDNHVRQCDLEWGIGLPLYGLYKYGSVTGDWARVKSHWPAAQRLAGYFDLADDYAWMTVCNAQDGYSTGTGDALNGGYAGMVAMLEMSRHLGDREAEAKYAYRAARMALLTAMRPAYTKWGRAHGMLDRDEAALGFWEKASFTSSRFSGDPWGVTTLLSADGCLPELMELYKTAQPSAWKSFLDEYAATLPDWYDATHQYPFEVTYNGNSGYVTFPHIYARAWFGASNEDLRTWIEAAQPNRNNAWVAPNAIAEVITQGAPLLLNGWGNAAIPSGTYTSDSAAIHVSAPGPVTLRLGLRRDIASLKVDGKAVPFSLVDGPLGAELPLPVPKGSHDIRISFGY
jgi:hypothetical protein